MKIRRLVTGLDSDGRSCIALDGPMETVADGKVKMIWSSEGVPARNDAPVGSGDLTFDFDIPRRGGTAFVVLELPPGKGPNEIWMHASNTLDYVLILRGKVEFVLETGRAVLEAGDVAVDRGVLHGARAIGDESAVMAVILIPAEPVGKGATV